MLTSGMCFPNAAKFPLSLSIGLVLLAASWPAQDTRGAPPQEKAVSIEGWTVFMDAEVSGDPELADRVGKELQARLADIKRQIPSKRTVELQRIAFYVQKHNAYATLYYSSHPEEPLYGMVVIGNAETFLHDIRDVPSRVLHELAHAYHNQVLGINDPLIEEAFRHAAETHLYENVADYQGRIHPMSYARNTKGEYFALLSQAAYARSGYYPFTRDELKDYDPVGWDAVLSSWETREGPQPGLLLQAPRQDGSCGALAGAKSRTDRIPVQLTVRNAGARRVLLSWISYKGGISMTSRIPAGGFAQRRTFSTHVWTVTDEDSGTCVGTLQVGPLGEHVEIL